MLCDSEQKVDFPEVELLPPPPLYADAFWSAMQGTLKNICHREQNATPLERILHGAEWKRLWNEAADVTTIIISKFPRLGCCPYFTLYSTPLLLKEHAKSLHLGQRAMS